MAQDRLEQVEELLLSVARRSAETEKRQAENARQIAQNTRNIAELWRIVQAQTSRNGQ